MHDIKFIRNNSVEFDLLMNRRGIKGISSKIIDLDTLIRTSQTEMQLIQEKRNQDSKAIGKMISQGKDVIEIQKNVSNLKEQLSSLDEKIKTLSVSLHNILNEIPNFFDNDVPDGNNESNNVLIKEWGNIPNFSFVPSDHVNIGENLNQMDFKTGVKIAGSRFVLLRGKLALLERALSSFMIDTHINDFNFEEISPPYIVKEEALLGTGQLPKFSDDLFCTTDKRWLIPTAEVPLTNIVSNEIIDKRDLPLRFVAYTPCFRSEAGSYGKDTRGMIRQHQFDKVEMVQISHPDSSYNILDEMVTHAENILQKLELPYRVVLLCKGDMGFGAAKTFDIEVWLPSQNTYREISSISNCEDFQARRLKARYKDADGKNKFLHTLNGSGLAVGRTLVAILENYQQENGDIKIPQALVPYMDGKKVLTITKA